MSAVSFRVLGALASPTPSYHFSRLAKILLYPVYPGSVMTLNLFVQSCAFRSHTQAASPNPENAENDGNVNGSGGCRCSIEWIPKILGFKQNGVTQSLPASAKSPRPLVPPPSTHRPAANPPAQRARLRQCRPPPSSVLAVNRPSMVHWRGLPGPAMLLDPGSREESLYSVLYESGLHSWWLME